VDGVEDLAVLVGGRVRAARRRGGLSLGALATAAGIGKGSLSELENGTRNPTLSTLYAVADALDVPLAALLDGRPGAQVASPGISARLLDVHDSGQGIVEVYHLVLTPGPAHRSSAHGPGVAEHLLVTSGRARAGREGDERELGVGESAAWISDVAHTYAALGEEPAECVLVIRSPGDPDPAAPAQRP
jgi:DNA-binding XRE family transcriptional regulator/quercetin dioxygenase-like cupin family protein